MARFERGDAYVETWVEGDSLLTRRGRLDEGAPPPRAEYVGRSDPAVDESQDQLDPGELAEHYARYRETLLQSELLRGGWRRVRDPDREEDVDDEPREPALERALCADPDDAAAMAVYADWLQQRGHPRGALIALQQQPTHADAEQLLRREAPALLGPLAGRDVLELRWKHGFIRSASIWVQGNAGEAELLLWDLLRHPSARFLRELRIFVMQRSLGCIPNSARLLIDLLLLLTPRPPLSHLALDVTFFDFNEPVELRAVGEAYPELQELAVRARMLSLGELKSPRLRRLTLDTFRSLAGLAAIVEGSWPELVELGLSLGPAGGHTAADLAPLLDGRAQLPRLRVLSIRDAPFADELCQRLASSPLAPALEILDLANGALTDAGAAALTAARDTFASLRLITVGGCPLSEAARADLGRVYPEVCADTMTKPVPGDSIAARPRTHRIHT